MKFAFTTPVPRVLLGLLGLLGASCSDDAPPEDLWTESVAGFVDAICTSPCRSGSEAQCRSDVGDELARAKMALDDNGQAKCEACLDVKAMLVPELANCMPTADQNMMVYAACDLDPTTDYDNDGDPTDDDTEACFGEP